VWSLPNLQFPFNDPEFQNRAVSAVTNVLSDATFVLVMTLFSGVDEREFTDVPGSERYIWHYKSEPKSIFAIENIFPIVEIKDTVFMYKCKVRVKAIFSLCYANLILCHEDLRWREGIAPSFLKTALLNVPTTLLP
jgi:hypothetical protein